MTPTIKPKYRVPKVIKVLLHLTEGSLNRLEALSACDDTCLNSTISRLANRHGILIDRKSEPHANKAGGVTHFTRYSLSDSSREFAIRLIYSYLFKVLSAHQIEIEYEWHWNTYINKHGLEYGMNSQRLAKRLREKAVRLISPHLYKT